MYKVIKVILTIYMLAPFACNADEGPLALAARYAAKGKYAGVVASPMPALETLISELLPYWEGRIDRVPQSLEYAESIIPIREISFAYGVVGAGDEDQPIEEVYWKFYPLEEAEYSNRDVMTRIISSIVRRFAESSARSQLQRGIDKDLYYQIASCAINYHVLKTCPEALGRTVTLLRDVALEGHGNSAPSEQLFHAFKALAQQESPDLHAMLFVLGQASYAIKRIESEAVRAEQTLRLGKYLDVIEAMAEDHRDAMSTHVQKPEELFQGLWVEIWESVQRGTFEADQARIRDRAEALLPERRRQIEERLQKARRILVAQKQRGRRRVRARRRQEETKRSPDNTTGASNAVDAKSVRDMLIECGKNKTIFDRENEILALIVRIDNEGEQAELITCLEDEKVVTVSEMIIELHRERRIVENATKLSEFIARVDGEHEQRELRSQLKAVETVEMEAGSDSPGMQDFHNVTSTMFDEADQGKLVGRNLERAKHRIAALPGGFREQAERSLVMALERNSQVLSSIRHQMLGSMDDNQRYQYVSQLISQLPRANDSVRGIGQIRQVISTLPTELQTAANFQLRQVKSTFGAGASMAALDRLVTFKIEERRSGGEERGRSRQRRVEVRGPEGVQGVREAIAAYRRSGDFSQVEIITAMITSLDCFPNWQRHLQGELQDAINAHYGG